MTLPPDSARTERELASARRALETLPYPPPLHSTLRCLIASLEQRTEWETHEERRAA